MKRWAALLFLLLVLLGLWRVLSLRMEMGEGYPEYSSLRTDPRGASLLFELLSQMHEGAVKRYFYAYALEDLQPKREMIVALGVPRLLLNQPGLWEEEVVDFVQRGGQVLLAFDTAKVLMNEEEASTVAEEAADLSNEEAERKWVGHEMLEGLYWQQWARSLRPVRDTEAAQVVDRFYEGDVLQHDEVWTVHMEDRRGYPYWLSKPYGEGAVHVLANSYALSNESLILGKNTPLILSLFPAGSLYSFDESKVNTGTRGKGIALLLREYGLFPSISFLVLAMLLWVWSQWEPLVRRPRSRGMDEVVAAPLRSGAAQAFQRNLSPEQAWRACMQEWEAVARHDKNFEAKRAQLESAAASAKGQVLEQYNQVVRIMK